MAIYGAGSVWNEQELKDSFFKDDYFAIGWDYSVAKDLYEVISLLKAGDIIYLKANRGGSRSIRVKGIGLILESSIHGLIGGGSKKKVGLENVIFSLPVKWIEVKEFHILIPYDEGKLTNVKASTVYEEHLPYIQKAILSRLFKINFKINEIMDYEIGQFVTGVISVGFQVLQIWNEKRDIRAVKNKVNQFDEITRSEAILSEGLSLQAVIPDYVLKTMRGRVEICWTDFNEAISNNNITPNQLDRYSNGLKECLCRELKVIVNLNGNLPNPRMQQWWDTYKCE